VVFRLHYDDAVAVVENLDRVGTALPDRGPQRPGTADREAHHAAIPCRDRARSDQRRRENLEREGWLVRVITAGDLFRSPAVLIGRILEDLHSRGHPGAPATPDHLSQLDRFAA
jgi:hypothetical protein